MKYAWVALTSWCSHAFQDDDSTPLAESKSLCGLQPPRQLVLPYNLPDAPKETHCQRCSRSYAKRKGQSDATD